MSPYNRTVDSGTLRQGAGHLHVEAHRAGMEQAHIDFVAKVLQCWNPLGAQASRIPDLDGYATEAVGILFNLQLGLQKAEGVVHTVRRW
jgi:hypothetical protein